MAPVENVSVCAALLAMTLLPLLEIVLRRLFGVGINGSTGIVQHLCLVVGMIGGVIAVRQRRLLGLSTLGQHLKGQAKTAASVFAGGAASATAAILCVGSAQFVATERQASAAAIYFVPVWAIQLIIPAGFALIAIHLLMHSGEKWIHRLAADVEAKN